MEAGMNKIIDATLGHNLAERLHSFVKQVQADNARRSRRELSTSERLDELEEDLGFIAMLQVATLRLLDDKGILKGEELVPRLMMADRLDGVEDGALSVKAMRKAIGLTRGGNGDEPPPPAATEDISKSSGRSGDTKRYLKPGAKPAPAPAAETKPAAEAKPEGKAKGKGKKAKAKK
jgi:hypothetical protein